MAVLISILAFIGLVLLFIKIRDDTNSFAHIKSNVILSYAVYDLFLRVRENFKTDQNTSNFICSEICVLSGQNIKLREEALKIMQFYKPSITQFPEIYNHSLYIQESESTGSWWNYSTIEKMTPEILKQKIKFLDLLIEQLTIIKKKERLPITLETFEEHARINP